VTKYVFNKFFFPFSHEKTWIPIRIRIRIEIRNTDFFFSLSDIADGLVGVGLITQSEDNPGFLTLDKGYNDMSKFLNRQEHLLPVLWIRTCHIRIWI
jgi:hypothetical protein